MGYVQQSGRHRARTLRKRELKTRNEIEQLREENRQLRDMVARLSELTVARIADEAADPGEQPSASADSIAFLSGLQRRTA